MMVMLRELRESLSNEAAGLAGREQVGAPGGESIDHTLNLARSLAERLAIVAHPLGAADGLRLARALMLDVVDLLEEHAVG